MDIALEQVFASAVRYIQSTAGENVTLYFDDLPENFMVPAIYFPVPKTTSRKVTFQSYLTVIHMEAWFMASSDWQAYASAAGARDCILLDDCRVGILGEDGTPTGKVIRVDNVGVSPIDTGIVRLAFGLKHYFSKSSDAGEHVGNVLLSCFMKQEMLYDSWYGATREQRKEEKEAKRCLEEALKSL